MSDPLLPAHNVRPSLTGPQCPTLSYRPTVSDPLLPAHSVRPSLTGPQCPTLSYRPTVSDPLLPAHCPTLSYRPTVSDPLLPAHSVRPSLTGPQCPTLSYRPTVSDPLLPAHSVRSSLTGPQCPTLSYRPTVSDPLLPAHSVRPSLTGPQCPILSYWPTASNVPDLLNLFRPPHFSSLTNSKGVPPTHSRPPEVDQLRQKETHLAILANRYSFTTSGKGPLIRPVTQTRMDIPRALIEKERTDISLQPLPLLLHRLLSPGTANPSPVYGAMISRQTGNSSLISPTQHVSVSPEFLAMASSSSHSMSLYPLPFHHPATP